MLENATAWAIHTPAGDFWEAIIYLGGFGLFCFFAAFYYLVRARIIEDTPTSKIRSAAQGYTELAGYCELIDGNPIKGPLTGKICTWFSYKIERYRRSGKRSRWSVVEQGKSEELFLVKDDTGQAIIDPEGAGVTASIKDVWRGSTRFPERYQGEKKRAWLSLGLKRYRYTEERMHPGDPIYAIGMFITRGGDRAEFNINRDVRELISEWKMRSDHLLAVHDKNQDGELDMKEWETVREKALEEVLAYHDELRRSPAVHFLGKTSDSRRPFLLSAFAESRLVKKMTLYSRLAIAGFFLTGIPAVWLIAVRLAQ
jgi:hypothetical protein